MIYLLVGVADAVGTLLRHVLGLSVQHFAPHASFSFGTLLVNLVGSFLLGWTLPSKHLFHHSYPVVS